MIDRGDFWFEDCMMMQVIGDVFDWIAFNDVVFMRVVGYGFVVLVVEVEGEVFGCYIVDVFVIAMLIGLMGYLFFVGGLIVLLRYFGLLVMLVVLHVVFDRVVFLYFEEMLRVHVFERSVLVLLEVDG